MARKKNYKEGELEQEFERFKFYHKYIVVSSTLQLSDSSLLEELVGYNEGDKEAFVEELMDNLEEKHYEENDDSTLDKLYSYCWGKFVDSNKDNANYKRNIKEV